MRTSSLREIARHCHFLVGQRGANAAEMPAADAVIMGMILHDWDLPAKRMLLGKAYASLPLGGSLIVCEMLIDDERRAHLPGLLMSLNMLIATRVASISAAPIASAGCATLASRRLVS